ncbi:MAG TPA: hypothetical protein VFF73_01400 [Planctomycetota bacterium]|nr:hypothetical protein [Planctomycetota bacterium]
MTTPSGMGPEQVVKGIELRLDTLIAGLQAASAKGFTSLTVLGNPTPITGLLSSAQAAVKPWKDCRAARAVIHAAVQSRPQDVQAARQLLNNVKAALVNLYGDTSQELTTFGYKPKTTPAKLTSAQKVTANAKRELTREARHVMGSRQKASIQVTGTPVVTIGPDGTLIAPPASTPVANKPNGAAKS